MLCRQAPPPVPGKLAQVGQGHPNRAVASRIQNLGSSCTLWVPFGNQLVRQSQKKSHYHPGPVSPYGTKSIDWRCRAKFEQFVSEVDTREHLLEYRLEASVADGLLTVQPLTAPSIEPTALLLTECFADATGYLPPFRRFMTKMLLGYLKKHMEMLPAAVVLVALLTPNASETPAVDATAAGSEGSAPPPANSTAAAGREPDLSSAAADGASGHQSESAGPAMRKRAWQQGWSGKAVSLPRPSGVSPDDPSVDTSVSSGSGSDGCTSQGGPRREQPVLVGTLELSFARRTRALYLTLNAPEDSAYLCNMAVDPRHRRRGYASAMLQAAEEVSRLVGHHTIYLHLRLVDEGAGSVYRAAGYREEKKDNFLVRLIGQDQRYLMAKYIGSTGGAAAVAPEAAKVEKEFYDSFVS